DSDGESEAILNPATGEELAQAASSTPEDVQEAVAAARRAFASWSRTTPAERSQALLAMAERLEENGEELARLEALNAGKPLAAVSSDEIPVMVDNLRFFAGGGEPTGQALISHPDLDMVSLTGSVETGKHIARTAADTLKRVHLELGGKAPVVVFDDVSLESALETIAGTGYYNAGQDCTAATRVLAEDDLYDNVVSGPAEQAKGLVLGDAP